MIALLLLSLPILIAAVFVVRIISVLNDIRGKQTDSSNDGGTIISTTPRSKPFKTLVVLGSGGHTTEMLHMLRHLNPENYTPLIYVVATTDSTSLRRFDALIKEGHHRKPDHIYKIPRSREVGQSYISSIGTTLYSLIHAVLLILRIRPGLVIANGPGTCLPIVVVTLLCRILGICEGRNIFVESFCRVKSLSLTGRVLYPIVDLFLVHWEELHVKFPRSQVISTFVPLSKNE